MKIKFEYTEKDYKKHLIKSRRINNITIFVLGLTIYLLITKNNVSLLFLPLFIIGLLVIIVLLNVLFVCLKIKLDKMTNNKAYGKYVVELTPNKFSVTINNRKKDYKYKNIKKIVEHKDMFKIKFKKSREYLTFEKNIIGDSEYKDLLKSFKEKIN